MRYKITNDWQYEVDADDDKHALQVAKDFIKEVTKLYPETKQVEDSCVAVKHDKDVFDNKKK